MFWNDPNLYGLTFKDVVPPQVPFLGSIQPWMPFQGIEPWRALPRFAPPYMPFGMTPQIPQHPPFPPLPQFGMPPQFPQQFGMTPPYFNPPITPFPPFQTAAIAPFFQPYPVNPSMFLPYRPFTF